MLGLIVAHRIQRLGLRSQPGRVCISHEPAQSVCGYAVQASWTVQDSKVVGLEIHRGSDEPQIQFVRGASRGQGVVPRYVHG